ncbi:gfo/Idh/MocA family oxidoreductase, partial [Streptomyces sp. NPDC001919]
MEQTESEAAPPTLGIGMVGYAFMGAAHSQGWRTAGRVFDLPLRPVLAAVAGQHEQGVGRGGVDRDLAGR